MKKESVGCIAMKNSSHYNMASSRNSYVTLITTVGNITIELYWDHAPKTCNNFFTLCKEGYYDGCLFHRIVRNFVIQTGDPSGTGKGGASIYGLTFEDEIHPDLHHVGAGVVSMANSGPNTNGSQFFVTLAPCPHLDGLHTIFGRVSSGMKVVQKLAIVEVNSLDRPVFDIKILRVDTATDASELLPGSTYV
ncbi:uncharacterized protein LOC128882843 [Hylaeus volcanicus]|uniref:uncharacterized protein LOC128882843 n=1 Tax=Hylaeus volcanicus TaxID=313075 RepID=UPI0023B80E21|nr:uncharacterized protein LOC128882843 [Hylaeus volcanicus]